LAACLRFLNDLVDRFCVCLGNLGIAGWADPDAIALARSMGADCDRHSDPGLRHISKWSVLGVGGSGGWRLDPAVAVILCVSSIARLAFVLRRAYWAVLAIAVVARYV
jgi:hypothetical protein